MALRCLGNRASVCGTSLQFEFATSFQSIIQVGRENYRQVSFPCVLSVSRIYRNTFRYGMAINAPEDASYRTETAASRGTDGFRVYNKLSKASRGFPKTVSLRMTRNVDIIIKQVGGPLKNEDYEPEYQHMSEEADMSEKALKPLPRELQPIPMDDNLPWGNSDNAIQEFDSDYDASDYQNTEDWDPEQDETDYSLSSNEALEPRNAFGLGEIPALTPTLSPEQLQPIPNNGKTSNASASDEPVS